MIGLGQVKVRGQVMFNKELGLVQVQVRFKLGLAKDQVRFRLWLELDQIRLSNSNFDMFC